MSTPLRILIVEDDAVNLLQLEMLLGDAGHTVVGTAMSASEAIRLTAELEPELVLLDINLRDGSSGLDVANALRDRVDVMMVFVTANPLRLSEDMAGAAAVIAKPFNEQALYGSIAYLEECVHRPPPDKLLPRNMRLAPAYSARLQGLRASL